VAGSRAQIAGRVEYVPPAGNARSIELNPVMIRTGEGGAFLPTNGVGGASSASRVAAHASSGRPFDLQGCSAEPRGGRGQERRGARRAAGTRRASRRGCRHGAGAGGKRTCATGRRGASAWLCPRQGGHSRGNADAPREQRVRHGLRCAGPGARVAPLRRIAACRTLPPVLPVRPGRRPRPDTPPWEARWRRVRRTVGSGRQKVRCPGWSDPVCRGGG